MLKSRLKVSTAQLSLGLIRKWLMLSFNLKFRSKLAVHERFETQNKTKFVVILLVIVYLITACQCHIQMNSYWFYLSSHMFLITCCEY